MPSDDQGTELIVTVELAEESADERVLSLFRDIVLNPGRAEIDEHEVMRPMSGMPELVMLLKDVTDLILVTGGVVGASAFLINGLRELRKAAGKLIGPIHVEIDGEKKPLDELGQKEAGKDDKA